MIYILVPILAPIIVYVCLPWFVNLVAHKNIKADYLLFAACFVYLVSWYLPSPLINGQNTSFTTHMIGGGVFSGLLWLYLKRSLKLKSEWQLELLSLFGLVSALGVLNELFELALVQFGIAVKIRVTDTSWDLVANTLGALVFWLVYRAISKKEKPQ